MTSTKASTSKTTGGSEPQDNVKETAKDIKSVAKAKANETVDQARQKAASSAEGVAGRVREAGEAFESDGLAHAAADKVAENLSTVANAVRSADLGAVKDDLSDFARRNPLLFFGGAALLGFAAARMMKASERADDAGAEFRATRSDGVEHAGSRAPGQERDWGYS